MVMVAVESIPGGLQWERTRDTSPRASPCADVGRMLQHWKHEGTQRKFAVCSTCVHFISSGHSMLSRYENGQSNANTESAELTIGMEEATGWCTRNA